MMAKCWRWVWKILDILKWGLPKYGAWFLKLDLLLALWWDWTMTCLHMGTCPLWIIVIYVMSWKCLNYGRTWVDNEILEFWKDMIGLEGSLLLILDIVDYVMNEIIMNGGSGLEFDLW